MSARLAVAPDVQPVDRGTPRVGERRDRRPQQSFPELPQRDGRKREPAHSPESETESPDGEHRIDIRV